jgi:hypothetical protein
MRPGDPVMTKQFGLGILLTKCQTRPAWWVLFGTFGRIINECDMELVQ